MQPQILMMDEPFSALDVLTSNILKDDFLNLWLNKETPIKSVILVTHSIEEAVKMANRVIILSSNPGKIISELPINLAYPRDANSSEFRSMVDQIYNQMVKANEKTPKLIRSTKDTIIVNKLHFVQINRLIGGIILLNDRIQKDKASLAMLPQIFHTHNMSEIFSIVETLEILDFASVVDGNIILKEDAVLVAGSDSDERKRIFAKHLLENIPLVPYIYKTLRGKRNNKVSLSYFNKYLNKTLSKEDLDITMQSIINYCRYAEIFAYDDNKKLFMLD